MFSSLSTLTKALSNVFIFLPYYFSVVPLIKTLFAPWKRIVPKEKRVGFSLSDYFNDLAFDWISRGIGLVIRLTTIFAYLFAQALYVPIALVTLVGYVILILPFQYLGRSLGKSEMEKYQEAKQQFIHFHTIDPQFVPEVEKWFDTWYSGKIHATRWWELNNLFNTIPLGRDWTQGYTPTLDQFAVDLSASAGRHETRPMTLGREDVMLKMEQILCKTDGANILMVGEEGVGKTTIIETLAYRIYKGRGNPLLAFKRLLEINLEKILASNPDTKAREAIIEELFTEAHEAGNIIFVIQDFDKYMSAGEGRVDLSTPFEKFLRSNRIHIIGTVTPFAYQKYLYAKQMLKSAFTLVEIPEVTTEVTLQILLEQTHRYESRYHVAIPYDTLVAAVQKSAFFISDIPFPEKALQLVDDACAHVKDHKNPDGTYPVVTPEVIDLILSGRTHVPTTLTESFKQRLLAIENKLAETVIGQDATMRELASALKRAFLLIGKRKKPLATFLFLGPTGVGKTETAKTLAREFFDSESNIIRFDMSEFQQVSDIARLIGDSESGNPGLLVSAMREKPYGVLLLDEMEKAHHDLLNIFLTLLDEGYVNDHMGKRVDGKSLVVIATSNAGALEFYADIANPTTLSTQNASPHTDIMSFLIEKRYFAPEFLNRFDGVIAFKPLSKDTAVKIARRMVSRVAENVQVLHNVTIEVSDDTLRNIVASHFDPQYGARDLERAIHEQVENVVAEKILTGEAKEGTTISL